MCMISFKPRLPGWMVKEDNIRDVCRIRVLCMNTLPSGNQSSSPSTLSEYPSAKVRGAPLTEYHINIGLKARFVNLWQPARAFAYAIHRPDENAERCSL
jgi:hypothetical protein